MSGIEVVRRLHEHRMWVNRKLRDAAAPLTKEQLNQPFEMGRGSVWATLTHLYAAEFVWLAALQGDEAVPLPGLELFDDLAQLGAAWDDLDKRWGDYLSRLDDAALRKQVRRKPTSLPVAIAVPASDVLLHVCTHAQYTTAQCANMLRHLGVKPPDTMLITLSRTQHQEA